MVTQTSSPVEPAQTPEVTADASALAEGVAPGVPVAEAPPTAPVRETPLVPAPEPSIEQRMQEELRQLSQRRAGELRAREEQVQQQEDAQVLMAYQSQLANQIEQKYGLAPEQATELAAEQARILYQSHQSRQAAQQVALQMQAKMQVATILAQRHNVPIGSLMTCDSPYEMEAVVAQAKVSAELQELRAELAKLKKGQVPGQTFSQGVTDSSGATATPDNIDTLYLKDPERYGPAYRKFLASR